MADRDSQITFRTENLEERLSLQPELSTTELQTAPIKTQKQRLNSLDIVRGLTMFGMIVVDCRGPDAAWWMKHPSWEGLSPADFVFPSFIFIMGMAVPLALSKTKPCSLKSIGRILGLFAIGLFLNLADAKFNFQKFRILGILQRLSLCYLLIVLIHFMTRYGEMRYRFIGVLIAIGLGLIYFTFMVTFENIEIGCPHAHNYEKFCNFGGYIDRNIFGKNHMIYPNDPEGLFSTLSAFLNGYIGYWFCLIMQDNKTNIKKTLALWTVFTVLIGALVYPVSLAMPISKKMWTISFVFLTAAASGLGLVLITFFVDVLSSKHQTYKKIIDKITTPFIWLGRNPLAIFVLMQALAIILTTYITIDNKQAAQQFYIHAFTSWIGDKYAASFLFGTFFAIFWTCVAGVMFRFNIFIRL